MLRYEVRVVGPGTRSGPREVVGQLADVSMATAVADAYRAGVRETVERILPGTFVVQVYDRQTRSIL